MNEDPERLKHPVNFVVIDRPVWPEISGDNLHQISTEKLSKYCVTGVDAWIIRTYYEMRIAGHPVTLSSKTVQNAINVVQVRPLTVRKRGFRDYVLIPRGDQHRPMLANFYLEQNNAVPPTDDSAFVPHWPQPGIVARAKSGGQEKFVVSYKGRLGQLDPQFRSEQFLTQLSSNGMEFDTGSMNSLYGDQDWNDYSSVDAVLAVRNATMHYLRHKPASKLVNAWFGEAPAVLGPEPAYRALRRSELDYVEVSTPAQALAALCRLRDDRQFYDQVVRNGRERRTEFTVDAIRRRWVELLNGEVARSFERWQARSGLYRKVFVGARSLLEPASKRLFAYRAEHGERLLPPQA